MGSAGGSPGWGDQEHGYYRDAGDRGAYGDSKEQLRVRIRSKPRALPPPDGLRWADDQVQRRVRIALAVGIVGIGCGVLAPVAVVLGRRALDDARGTDHESTARTARVLGTIGSTLWLCIVGYLVLGALGG